MAIIYCQAIKLPSIKKRQAFFINKKKLKENFLKNFAQNIFVILLYFATYFII